MLRERLKGNFDLLLLAVLAAAPAHGCGLNMPQAVEQAITRFGPPSAIARGLPRSAAYRTFLAQLVETALLLVSLLCLAGGVAAIPAGVLGLAGNTALVTGDPQGQTVPADRCRQLAQMTPARDCAQVLATHLQEVLRNHLLGGVAGFVILVLCCCTCAGRPAQSCCRPDSPSPCAAHYWARSPYRCWRSAFTTWHGTPTAPPASSAVVTSWSPRPLCWPPPSCARRPSRDKPPARPEACLPRRGGDRPDSCLAGSDHQPGRSTPCEMAQGLTG